MKRYNFFGFFHFYREQHQESIRESPHGMTNYTNIESTGTQGQRTNGKRR